MNTLPQMEPVSLNRLLSTQVELLQRLYRTAGPRHPDALEFEQLLGADFGDGLYALLGLEHFQEPSGSNVDSNAFITSACLDLVDVSGGTLRGRAVVCDMRLGLAAVRIHPKVITEHMETRAHDHGIVFAAVQHTRELGSHLKTANGERRLMVRYIDCITVTDKSRRDEDGTLLVHSLLNLGTSDLTHAMIIPDGANERAVIECLGFQRASGRSSCWFCPLPIPPLAFPAPAGTAHWDLSLRSGQSPVALVT